MRYMCGLLCAGGYLELDTYDEEKEGIEAAKKIAECIAETLKIEALYFVYDEETERLAYTDGAKCTMVDGKKVCERISWSKFDEEGLLGYIDDIKFGAKNVYLSIY